MKLLSVFFALAVLLASVPVSAQQDSVRFEVPETGYSGTDIFRAGDLWNQYIVHVEKGHELLYSFEVVGNGEISVSLIPGKHPTIYSEHYTRFSTSQPVSSYSATFPADVGFDKDYSIVVNSSYPGDIEYTVTISTSEAEVPDYSLHYILMLLGFAALVVFCWKLVVWQEAREKEKKRKGKHRS